MKVFGDKTADEDVVVRDVARDEAAAVRPEQRGQHPARILGLEADELELGAVLALDLELLAVDRLRLSTSVRRRAEDVRRVAAAEVA